MNMSLTLGEIQDLVHYLGEDNNLPSSLASVKLKLQEMLPTFLPECFEAPSQAQVRYFHIQASVSG